MRIHLISLLAILFISFVLYSCVDEPTVPEVKRPYTSVRLANFSENVAKINVNIDGEINYSVNQNQLTDRFDLDSGQRRFVLTTDNGDTIHNARIAMPSYEEVTLLFSGYSAPGDDFNNTFTDFTYSEGVVYIQDGPDADTSSWVHYINVIGDTPNSISRPFTLKSFSDIEEDDRDNPGTESAFNTVVSEEIPTGNRTFMFLYQTNESQVNRVYDTLGVYNADMEGGVRHYLFLTGRSDTTQSINVVKSSQVPLPDRSK